MKLKANFHTHTVLCDGKNTPEEMVQRALELGFTHLGFSGHMDPDIHMDLPEYDRQIRILQEKYAGRIEILRGIELDALYDPSCGENAEFIIGSTHFLDVVSDIPMAVDNTEEILQRLAREFYGGDYYRLAKAYYELEAQVYDRLGCTFIGHFDLVVRFNDALHFLDEEDPRYTRPALEAMEYLVSEGVPFEINCGAVNRNRKKELYPNMFLLKSLREMGGEILINSDAHQAELLDGGFDAALKAAAACGFDHINLLTKTDDGNVRPAPGRGCVYLKELRL